MFFIHFRPQPKITWEYQGFPIRSRYNNGTEELNFEFFQIAGGGQILKIRRVTRYSGGTFRCIATNSLGKTWRTGQLSVLCKSTFLKKVLLKHESAKYHGQFCDFLLDVCQ